MKLQVALHLSSWAWLWTLLCAGKVTGKTTVYRAVNGSGLLNLPLNFSRDFFEVYWNDANNKRMGRYKTTDEKPSLGDQCGCDLYRNGSLRIHELKAPGEQIYMVTVYDGNGKQLNNDMVTLIVMEKVNMPVIGYNCSERKVRVSCMVSSGTEPEIHIQWNGEVKTRVKSYSLETSIHHMGKAGTVTCTAMNKVSNVEQAMEVNCANVWSIYMILAVVGGGVVFIIFLILLVYCVRLKCSKCRGRRGEEVSISYQPARHYIQQRQLPEPPTCRPCADRPERSPGHKNPIKPAQTLPTTKGTDCKRPQEPAKGPQPLNKPPQKPSIPLNHPSEVPPRPQPRQQSQQPRKKH